MLILSLTTKVLKRERVRYTLCYKSIKNICMLSFIKIFSVWCVINEILLKKE